MGGFFSSNNILFRASERIMDVCVLSLMWLLCSLPVLTVVPASSALYYSCVKCLRRGEKGPYVNFLRAFRDNLKTGIAVSAVFLPLAAALVWANLMLARFAPAPAQIAYLVLMLLPVGALTCASALLSRFSCTPGSLLRDAARITIGHLPRVAAAAAITALTAFLCVRYALFLVWIFLPATCALLISRLLEPVLKRYTPGYEDYAEVPIEDRPWYFR